MKKLALIALTLIVATPVAATAADGRAAITKGKKIYQAASRSSDVKAQNTDVQASKTVEDLINIQPAAGAEETPEYKGVYHKELRLPRKK